MVGSSGKSGSWSRSRLAVEPIPEGRMQWSVDRSDKNSEKTVRYHGPIFSKPNLLYFFWLVENFWVANNVA